MEFIVNRWYKGLRLEDGSTGNCQDYFIKFSKFDGAKAIWCSEYINHKNTYYTHGGTCGNIDSTNFRVAKQSEIAHLLPKDYVFGYSDEPDIIDDYSHLIDFLDKLNIR